MVIVAGCGATDDPVPDSSTNLFAGAEADLDVEVRSDRVRQPADLAEWSERILEAVPATEFGLLDGALGAVLGEIVDIESDPNGNVLVLDGHSHDLKVFDAAGALLQTVGRAGRGPAEFTGPSSLVWASPDTLIVFDDTRRGTRFVSDSGGELRFLDTFATTVGVERACVGDEGVWVHGLGDTSPERLHLLRPEAGTVARSTATAEAVENRILERRRAVGFLDCTPGSLLILTSRYFPTLHAYAPEGALAWTADLSGFIPMEFTIVDRGGLRQGIAPGAGGFHWILSAVLLDEGTALVQVGWQTVESSRAGLRAASIESHLVELASGRTQSVPRDLPIVLHANELGFLAARDDPFPQVIRYEFGPP